MQIPQPTSSVQQACVDLATSGVAILRDVLTLEEVVQARSCLANLAKRERLSGHAVLEDGSSASGAYRSGHNQRVPSLLTNDAVFAKMATNPRLMSAAEAVFSSNYEYPEEAIIQYGFHRAMLSSMTANIANPGGKRMELHSDQGFVPPSTPFPILLNAILPLVDFTRENGATHVALESHLANPVEMTLNPPETQQIEATAGCAILIDGRTWHGTGENRTTHRRPAILLNYCPPWVRPFTNHGIELDESFLAAASADLLELLGYKRWFVFGASEIRTLTPTHSAE